MCKKVALNKGSNVHNLLVRVLAAGGLKPADVECVYLKPSDARAAFENGSVDAWAIWDPYLAAAQTALPTRVVSDGVAPGGRVIDENHQYFLATRDYATHQADVLRAVMADLRETEAYGAAHRDEVARLLAPAMGMDLAAVRTAVGRMGFGVQPMDAKAAASQQDVADTLLGLGVIPSKVNVKEALLF